MRVSRKPMVFNVLNELKYLEKDITYCSLISSQDSLVQKQFIKGRDDLEQELGKEDKNVLVKEGLMCGPHFPNEEKV